MRQLSRDGRLALAGFSPLRITVPLVLGNMTVAYTSFWLTLVSDSARLGCFDTSNVHDVIGITVPILPLTLLINELECFLDNVRDGHRYRTVLTAGGVNVLKWTAASTCAVCALFSAWAVLNSIKDDTTHCTAGLALNSALLCAMTLGLCAMPRGLAALQRAPLAGLSPDASFFSFETLFFSAIEGRSSRESLGELDVSQ